METIIASVITAVITGGMTLIGVLISNGSKQAVLETRLAELTRQVEKHNSVIERTYKLEEITAVQTEQLKVVNNRLKDLENDGK